MSIPSLLLLAAGAGGPGAATFPPDIPAVDLCRIAALGTADRGPLHHDATARRLAADEAARRRVDCGEFAGQIAADDAVLRAAAAAHAVFHANPMPRLPPPDPSAVRISCTQGSAGLSRCVVQHPGRAERAYLFDCPNDVAAPPNCRSVHPSGPAGSDVPVAVGGREPPRAGGPAQPVEPQRRLTRKRVIPYAAVVAAARWKHPTIPVCWENADDANAEGREWTRIAVAQSWEKESALRFTGWRPCDRRHDGIRILVKDTGPHVAALGRRLAKRRFGMVLNFDFQHWSPSCRSKAEHCVKSIAVHEFGHALGFTHEQNRHDAPGECREKRQGSAPDTLLTPYDPASVMNYCNFKWNNEGVLSDDDVAAVRLLYGKPLRP